MRFAGMLLMVLAVAGVLALGGCHDGHTNHGQNHGDHSGHSH
jgi:hypothetical protein